MFFTCFLENKKQHDFMSHLKPLFFLQLDVTPLGHQETVMIISDSTLNVPGVLYALSCVLRQCVLRLVWEVAEDGYGARGILQARKGAPFSNRGLNVIQPERRYET